MEIVLKGAGQRKLIYRSEPRQVAVTVVIEFPDGTQHQVTVSKKEFKSAVKGVPS